MIRQWCVLGGDVNIEIVHRQGGLQLPQNGFEEFLVHVQEEACGSHFFV